MIMKKTILLLCAFMAAITGMAQSGVEFTQGENGTLNGKVSSNGRWLVGTSTASHAWGPDYIIGYESFLTDLSTGETKWLTSFDESDYSKAGQFADVNNDGVICGVMKDSNYEVQVDGGDFMLTLPLNVAAVWKDGKAESLGLGTYGVADFNSSADGTFATALSNDAKTIVGYVSIGNYANVYPCGWVLNETTGKYDFVKYAYPENTIAAQINDVSGDGKIAAGSVRLNDGSSYACFWPTPEECVLIQDDGSGPALLGVYAQAFAVSDNGEYIGATTDGLEPVLYSVLDRNIRRKLGSYSDATDLSIGGVTDNGDVFGSYSYMYGNTRTFWYSMDNLTTTGFDYYLYLHASDLEIPYEFDYWSSESLSFSGVSADGKVFVGNDTYGSPWVLTTNPGIVIIPPTVGKITATATSLGEITVSFNRIELEEYMWFKAKAYVVYRNGEVVDTVGVDQLDAEGAKTVTVIDKNVDEGTYRYSAAVLYANSNTGADMLSPEVEGADVYMEANHEFPLYDNFDTQSLQTNGWTVQRDYGETDFENWGIGPYFGLDGSPFLMTTAVFYEPYSYSLVSRHLDASDKENVYISFARMWQYCNSSDWDSLEKDSLSVEVSSDGLNWTSVKDFVLSNTTVNRWSFEYLDITPYAAGKTFQVRLRVHGQAVAQYIWSIENLTIDEKPQHEGVSGADGAADGEGNFKLIWKNSLGAYSLNYLQNPYLNAIPLTVGDEGKPFIAVNKFDESDLDLYNGKYLTSVTTQINQYESEDKTPIRVAIVVYENGELIREQEIETPEYNKYITVKLDEPVLIDNSKQLMFGLKLLEYGADQTPIVYHNTMEYVDGKSNLYSQDGGNTWLSLNDYFMTVPEHETDGCASWFISGNVTDTKEMPAGQLDTNQYVYEVYKNGYKYTDLFVHFMQPGFTDENSVTGDVYEVRAFYLDGTVSELSAQVKNDGTTGISDIVAGNGSEGAYTVEDGKLTVGDGTSKVEIYNAEGLKVYEGAGTGVSLGSLGHGMFILKVYGEDGTTATHKLVF